MVPRAKRNHRHGGGGLECDQFLGRVGFLSCVVVGVASFIPRFWWLA
jgi:hypothetical protein